MEYFYIKLGRGNSLLSYWLQLEEKKNPLGTPHVCIYFYKIPIEEYRGVNQEQDFKNLMNKYELKPKAMHYQQSYRLQIKPFIEKGRINEIRFITIHKGVIYIMEPMGEAEDLSEELTIQFNKDLEEMREDLTKKYNWKKNALKSYDGILDSISKVRRVRIIKEIKEKAPHILLTLSTVRYYNSGTFRLINPKENIGVYRALSILTGDEEPSPKKLGFDDILELLSPHQFETLVFLILLNNNLYCPAWRAGSLPGIDIIGINYTSKSIFLGNPTIEFPPGKEITFQLKRKRSQKHFEEAYRTIAISARKKETKVLDAIWLYSSIKDQEKTIEWLEHSLEWYIQGTKFSSIMELLK